MLQISEFSVFEGGFLTAAGISEPFLFFLDHSEFDDMRKCAHTHTHTHMRTQT